MYLVHDLAAIDWPLSDKNNLQSRRLEENAKALDDKTVIKLLRHAGASDKEHQEGADGRLMRRSCARLVQALRDLTAEDWGLVPAWPGTAQPLSPRGRQAG